MKINEQQLRQIIREALNELDWKTYASAADKANKWRGEHPFLYDRNRGLEFDRAAQDAFLKQHDITNEPNYGGERGNINFTSIHGKPEISGSRNHDFGDEGGPFDLKHHVYHMGKKYGKDGGYGRSRMWDFSHDTTPEEFYGNDEMAQKFRDAEKDVEDYNNGNYEYSNDKGWHLKNTALEEAIKKSIHEVLNRVRKLPKLSREDLMEGDWVCIAPYEFYDEIYELEPDGVYSGHGDSAGSYRYDELEPIPITSEFLDYNGFNTSFASRGGGFVSFTSHKNDIPKEAMLPIYKAFNNGQIKYVHELQHALKKQGIKKYIDFPSYNKHTN